MSDSTDYDAVNVPDRKPREDYSYLERRAENLERIERAGPPDAVNELEEGPNFAHFSFSRCRRSNSWTM